MEQLLAVVAADHQRLVHAFVQCTRVHEVNTPPEISHRRLKVAPDARKTAGILFLSA